MNYLAPTHAVSLFPWTTFVDRATLICQDVSKVEPNQRWMEKYRGRGWDVLGGADSLPASKELKAWERRVGDGFSWVMPYRRAGRLLSPIPHHSSDLFDSGFGEQEVLSIHKYAFEVLDVTYEVAASGAALRVGLRFMYRSVNLGRMLPLTDHCFSSLAHVLNPYRRIGIFRSLESLAPFMNPTSDDEGGSDLTPTEAETDVESGSSSDSQDEEIF